MSSIETSLVLADNITAPIHNITNALKMTVMAFQGVQSAASHAIDTSTFDEIWESINAATAATQAFQNELNSIKTPNPTANTPQWDTQSNIEVFQNTGIERLNLEMGSLNDLTNDVLRSQQRIGEQALNMDVLPPNASWDINFANQRIEELAGRLSELQNMDVSLIGENSITQFNTEFEALRSSMNNIVNLQDDMNAAIEQGDLSRLNADYNHLNNIAGQVEQRIRSDMAAIEQMSNIEWISPQNTDIFSGNAVQRYQHEIQSANAMLSRMTEVQQQISQRASSMRILPPQAVNDMTAMSSRVQNLQLQIEQMQSERIQIVGVERANAEMEVLRHQLNQALLSQEDLNNALDGMDISAANAAYARLNGIVDTTERNIRDNIEEQQRFNQEIRGGSSAADGLQSKILGIAAAYLSVQGAGKALDLSDTMAQNNARLDLIVDDGGSVDALQDKIFLSAERARGDYVAVSQTVAKLGLLAGDAFSSNDEMIAFTEQMNKNFIIGGASIQEQTSAMYQLTQAMASGRLQGDEYRSIIENAPLLAGAIEQYMTNAGVEGTMKEWAADGLLTAEVIKSAMFSVADETNARFENMPKTFAQVATGIKNNAIMAFEPVLARMNEVANSQAFQVFTNNAIDALVTVSGIVMMIFTLFSDVGESVADNWSLIAPVVFAVAAALAIYGGYLAATNILEAISYGLKMASVIAAYMHYAALTAEQQATLNATAAQYGFNTALLACPITWIIIAIIALIAAVYLGVAAFNKFAETSVSATGIVFGAFTVLGAFLWNLFLGFLELVLGVINALINPFIDVANFMGNVFQNPVSSIIYLFQSMGDNVLAVLQRIASAMDFVFGSNMADAVAGWRSGLRSMADSAIAEYAPNENYQRVMDNLDLSVGSLGLKRWEYGDAWEMGYAAGENLDNAIVNFDPASLFDSNIPTPGNYASEFDYSAGSYDPVTMAQDVSDINSNTSDLKAFSEEDLKYLRDIAERETINKFTLAEINFEMGGVHNTVNNEMDLDGITEYIGDSMMERLEIVAEGVYA